MAANVGVGRVVKLRARLRSTAINLMFSSAAQRVRRTLHEVRRRAMQRPHAVSVFVELDDPYSYLLCNYLDEFRDFYDVDLRLCLAEAVTGAYRPAPQLYPEYALEDCRRLARELGIPFLDRGDSPPVEHRRSLLATLASRPAVDGPDNDLVQAVSAYWRGDTEAVARRADNDADEAAAARQLEENQAQLVQLGHYNTAMLHYGGEWYWGVDRLHYLVDRLDQLGAAKEQGLAPRIASIRPRWICLNTSNSFPN